MSRCISLFALLGMVVLVGCSGDTGGELELAPVKGTLTLDGAPLPNAIVTFQCDAGGRPAKGRTNDQGEFELMTSEPGDGAMIGSHKVSVIADTSSASAEINSEDAYAVPDPNATQASPIPVIYANLESSGFTAQVTADGENDFKFDLKKN